MKRLTLEESGLNPKEYRTLAALTTPAQIQDFLDTIPFNFEESGDTHLSPRRVLEENRAHCIEGAMLAAAALWIRGEEPLILNLSAKKRKGDVDHVIALYKRGGLYGAISKTNHSTLRFRDPVYRSPRELAVSYFHEWFLDSSGEKTLECYSLPLSMRRFGTKWIASEKNLWDVADALGDRTHFYLVPPENWKHVRKADAMELKAGKLVEWEKRKTRGA